MIFSAFALPAAAAADPAPSQGQAFEPRPLSQPLYGTKPPSEDPDVQRHIVKAGDDVDLYVETWLPAAEEGRTPPARVPTILVMTPYVAQGIEEYPPSSDGQRPGFIAHMTARGYAVAQHHVRGTGESGGCIEQTGPAQIDDGARVVEYLGRDAPWSNGVVGMYGISYDAETQISTAGLGDPARVQPYLKAIIPASSVAGQYEYSFFDGVPYTSWAARSNFFYLVTSAIPGETSTPAQVVQKLTCQPEVMTASADHGGDMTPFWKVREYRPGATRITAPTLMMHGLRDFNVQPITLGGFFDRLPDTVPHKGIFGVWPHAFPDRHAGIEPDWERADFHDVVVAWFDRYLKGLDTGVEAWPPVQVQGSDGQWRAEPEFPSTGGPVGQLGLGPGGALGDVAEPSGSTSYVEGASEAQFTSPPAPAPLHLTGQPVADLWLTTNVPDGHLSARLEVLDSAGSPLVHQGTTGEGHVTYGFRSLRHLDPMPEGYFVQEQGHAPATGTALRVPLRFLPTDLLVPAGGSLRLTISGALEYRSRQTGPGEPPATIEILHECGHPSALRFLLPRHDAPLLNVREKSESGALAAAPAPAGIRDGGGLATAALCGKPPERPAELGPERAGWPPPAAPAPATPAGGAACRDTIAPAPRVRSARFSRRRIALRGTAQDRGCGAGGRGMVARVAVSVVQRTGRRCRSLGARGRLSRPRACRRTTPRYLPARGTAGWRLTVRGRLRRGRYVVRVRAIDTAGNRGSVLIGRRLR